MRTLNVLKNQGFFRRGYLMAFAALFFSACSVKVNLPASLNKTTTPALLPASIASFTITNTSPTKATTLNLNFVGFTGALSKYCIKENSVVVAGCSWVTASSLPATYNESATSGALTLTVFLQGTDGTISSGVSSNTVTIDQTAPAVTVTAPNGGELWAGASSHNITWTATDAVGVAGTGVSIDYSTNGSTWTNIATGLANSGTYSWTLPSIDSTTVTVRVTAVDAAGNSGSDVSNANFEIDSTPPQLASATILNSTPTGFSSFALSYGAITGGSYSHYCINLNNTSVAACAWTAGTLPDEYAYPAVAGAKVLSIWLKDSLGHVQPVRVDTNSVTYSGTVAIAPASITATAAKTTMRIFSGRWGASTLNLSNGNVFIAGGMVTLNGTDTGADNGYLFANATHKYVGTPPMSQGRKSPALIELSNGNIIAIGGCTSSANAGSTAVDLYDVTQNKWFKLASLATARCNHTATLLPSGRILVAGGQNGATYHSSTEIYYPNSGVFVAGPAMGSARLGHAAVKLSSNKIALIGGSTGAAALNTVTIYDPSTNSFSAGPSFTTARQDFGAMLFTSTYSGVAGDGVVITGGFDGATYLSSTEFWDVSGNTWSAKASMSVARRYPALAPVPANDQFLVAGGLTAAASYTNVTELYDLSANTWTARNPITIAQNGNAFPTSMNSLGVFGDGTYLEVGGKNTNGALVSTFEYNLAGNTWSEGYDLPLTDSFYSGASAALTDGRVITCGGRSQTLNTENDECWVFDPATHNYSVYGRLRTGKAMLSLTTLTNGKVVIAGGCALGCSQLQVQVDIFDPTTNTFSTGADMPFFGQEMTAIPLTGDRVLYTGVWGGPTFNFPLARNYAYIYTYGTNSWAATSNLPAARSRMASVVTPSGRVFVYGGYATPGAVDTYYGDLYEYNVGAGTWTTLAASPTLRKTAGLFAYSNAGSEYIYAIGGSNAAPLSTVEMYDITGAAWSAKTSVPDVTGQPFVAGRSDIAKLWVIGGTGGNAGWENWEYNITGDTWAAIVGPADHQWRNAPKFNGTVMADGRIYIFDGYFNSPGEVISMNTPVTYSATGGNLLYTFTKAAGGGVLYEKLKLYFPPFPSPGGTATINVQDTNAINTSSSTVTY